MKTILMAIAVILTASTTTFSQVKKTKPSKTTSAKQYTCSMHPEVVSAKPGKCPKCGMALVAKAATAAKYTCTMDPEVVSDKPGKCPKCGMNLTKMKGDKMDKDSAGMKM